jgi:type VI secretion system protein ImpJ
MGIMDDHGSYGGSALTEDGEPRPSYRRLALHRWEMGEVLYPAQLRAQEQALLEHVGLRAQLAGLPSHGVAQLRWNEAQLARGDLSISMLTVVLPSGLLIDYPGNAALTPRKLSVPAKAAGSVPIYLHVRSERRPDDARDLLPYKDDAREIRRTIYQIEITAEPRSENVQEWMKLAELSCHAGAWALAPYVPPLLRLGHGTTPFLRDALARVATAIDGFESELVRRAADSVVGAAQLSEVRRVLAAIYRARAVLADHGYAGATQTVALHPYHLFAALRDFYVEAVVPQGKALDAWPLRYQHDDLRGCFEQLARGLDRGLTVPTVASPRLTFHRQGDRFVAEPFPGELCSASQVFLLLERAPQAPVLDEAEPLDIKLASPRRAWEVYKRALEGVPLDPRPALSFDQTFGDRARVFALDTKHREWQDAVEESALCFTARGLKDFSASLFWQSPGHG